MTQDQAWEMIISKLIDKNIELHTVPKTKKTPIWFTAATNGNTIFINKAVNNRPSSKLTNERKLTYQEFQKVYPLYLRREKGEPVSSQVTAITRNQVYYFSLIKHFCYGDLYD